jgi:hypothetical protein
MTTENRDSSRKSLHANKRLLQYAAAGFLLILVLIIAFNFAAIKGNAQLGTAYAAHVNCSCRYIEGRDMESCATDAEAGMAFVSVSDDPEDKRVSASVPFLAKAVAEQRGEFGCIALTEEEMDALD